MLGSRSRPLLIMKYELLQTDPKHRRTLYNSSVTRKETIRDSPVNMKFINKENLTKAIYYAAVLLIIAGAFYFVSKVNKTQNTIKLNQLELKSTQFKLKELNSQYDKVLNEKTVTDAEKASQDAKVQELEKAKTELEQQLQSRIAEKARVASIQASQRVYAASSHSEWLAAAGIPQDQWAAAEQLVHRESSWNPNAYNSIGACSLVQALPCSKIQGDWRDPVTALKWGHSYVVSRYGTWGAALQHSLAHNWY